MVATHQRPVVTLLRLQPQSQFRVGLVTDRHLAVSVGLVKRNQLTVPLVPCVAVGVPNEADALQRLDAAGIERRIRS